MLHVKEGAPHQRACQITFFMGLALRRTLPKAGAGELSRIIEDNEFGGNCIYVISDKLSGADS